MGNKGDGRVVDTFAAPLLSSTANVRGAGAAAHCPFGWGCGQREEQDGGGWDNVTTPFAQRLWQAAEGKNSRVVVGLDPQWQLLPPSLAAEAERRHGKTLDAVEWAITRFNETLVEAMEPVAVAVKLQAAFYEQFGWRGWRAMERSVEAAREKGLLVIIDGKRNDIASSAQAYSNAFLGRVPLWNDEGEPAFDADALTVNPYLGSDGLMPFIEDCDRWGKGVFVLVRTSNPSAGELQDLPLRSDPESNPYGFDTVVEAVGHRVEQFNESRKDRSGYGPIGAVVGATYPQEAARLRALMPSTLFLVPGYGAQGAGAEDVRPAFDEHGWGAIVNSSRGICYAYRSDRWRAQYGEARYGEAARAAAEAMRADIASVLP